mmetsp:Transcript_2173/g.1874  ORF Transcript_2173/g.1874 Transcript_2173/m.1874 type:complete len:126 (-) Transcript_2173:301-678(-)
MYENLDMCGQGDAQIVGDWRRTHSLQDLKKMVEDGGHSAVTISSGNPSFGHAAIKRFDYKLELIHLKPISTCCRHPCNIHIFTRAVSKEKNVSSLEEMKKKLHITNVSHETANTHSKQLKIIQAR